MTYMYEYPEYIRIDMPEPISQVNVNLTKKTEKKTNTKTFCKITNRNISWPRHLIQILNSL